MKIRLKILSGFLILVAMLAVAGTISVYEFNKISSSMQGLIDENYAVISACEEMLEALEREDSGVLLVLLGYGREEETGISQADSVFRAALEKARASIKAEAENLQLSRLGREYSIFRQLVDTAVHFSQDPQKLNWYFTEPYRQFSLMKSEVKSLMQAHRESMYRTAGDLQDKARRAVMPGIVAIVSALVFSLMFNYYINHFMVKPIGNIIASIEKFRKTREATRVTVETRDELRDLADSVENLFDESVPSNRKLL
jgi:methyl-accepting chemotaxis protein